MNMLKLMLHNQDVNIDMFEIESLNTNYTYYTIQHLLKKYNGYHLTMVIGKDQLKNIHKWYNYDFILKNIDIICFNRGKFEVDQDSKIKNIKFIDFCFSYSSRDIRNSIKNKENIDSLIIAQSVLDYI